MSRIQAVARRASPPSARTQCISEGRGEWAGVEACDVEALEAGVRSVLDTRDRFRPELLAFSGLVSEVEGRERGSRDSSKVCCKGTEKMECVMSLAPLMT